MDGVCDADTDAVMGCDFVGVFPESDTLPLRLREPVSDSDGVVVSAGVWEAVGEKVTLGEPDTDAVAGCVFVGVPPVAVWDAVGGGVMLAVAVAARERLRDTVAAGVRDGVGVRPVADGLAVSVAPRRRHRNRTCVAAAASAPLQSATVFRAPLAQANDVIVSDGTASADST